MTVTKMNPRLAQNIDIIDAYLYRAEGEKATYYRTETHEILELTSKSISRPLPR